MSDFASSKSKVVVATTVMLSFISFGRAAAIVLSDLTSSAYYAGGIAESAVGKPAPWFILGIMLFGFAIQAIYLESSSSFVRGGAYKVVREAVGGTVAKVSVSALMFDYVLTGPISAVSAGLYLATPVSSTRRPATSTSLGAPRRRISLPASLSFWLENTIGIRESSDKAVRIMLVTTVMVVILIAWCLLTALTHADAGVPGSRGSEAEEPAAHRPGSDSLQHGVHLIGLVLRRDADPRRGESEVPGQFDWWAFRVSFCNVFTRAAPATAVAHGYRPRSSFVAGTHRATWLRYAIKITAM